MRIERTLLRFITLSNWIIFGIATASGFILAPGHFAWGILAGGLIVTVNFHLMYRSLRQTLKPPHVADTRVILGKHGIRFLLTVAVIFVLIAAHYVHPLGLIIGLSVVVVSIMVATACEIKKLIFKEAI